MLLAGEVRLALALSEAPGPSEENDVSGHSSLVMKGVSSGSPCQASFPRVLCASFIPIASVITGMIGNDGCYRYKTLIRDYWE